MTHGAEFVAEVVPLLRLPRSLGIFDYLTGSYGERLQAGQLVYVPFRGRQVAAVVMRTKPYSANPAYRYATVISTIPEFPPVAEVQRNLAAWIARYYLQSPASVFHAMLPRIPSRVVPPPEKVIVPPLTIPNLVGDEFPFVEKTLRPGASILLQGNLRPECIAHLVKEVLAQQRQMLILVPEVTRADALHGFLARFFGPAAMIFPDFNVLHATWQFWRTAARGDPMVVIGTRRAVFAPLKNLTLILMLAEDDGSYKQWDQNPRYHAREVALKLAELQGCGVLLQTFAPTVTSYANSTAKLFDMHTIAPSKPPLVELVDLKAEYAMRNFNPLSRRLQEILSRVPSHSGLQALLLVNRKGTATFVRCRDCGYVPRCPQCATPFRYVTIRQPDGGIGRALESSGENLHCYRCGLTGSLPAKCPTCGGPEFRAVGFGSRRVAGYAQSFVRDGTVRRLDADCSQQERTALLGELARNEVTVLVGTAMVRSLPEITRVPMVAVLAPDAGMQQADFRASERTLQLLLGLRAMASERLIIQTHLARHPLYQVVQHGQIASWYDAELAGRQALSYPPFGRLIRLTYAHASQAMAVAQSETVAERLRRELGVSLPTVQVFGPQKSSGIVRARRQVQEIIIKIPVETPRRRVPVSLTTGYSSLAAMLNALPTPWVVDVDPDTA
ncbi:MAG: primosomal protein N' [Patescibacteria group bacterium]|nr:primosomal protein N' [Patescibacteria group bacterium]